MVQVNATVRTPRRRVRPGAMWATAGLAVLAFVFMLRQALIALFTEWNRWQLASRPELENWIIPEYGVELPATLWAIALVALGVFFTLIAMTVRLRRT